MKTTVATLRVPLSSLVDNPDNPRFIEKDAFEKLIQSLIELPDMLLHRPLVCVTSLSGYMPLGGNMRKNALREIQKRFDEAIELQNYELASRMKGISEILEEGVPVTLADHWTEAQRREFIIKDNNSYGKWDWDVLANEWNLPQLVEWGVDIPDFKKVDLVLLETQEDNFNSKELDKVYSAPGDIYEIGEHRVKCGDSTNSDDILNLMAGEKANLCFTSPPYWVGKEYEYQDNEEQINQFIYDVTNGIAYAVSPICGRIVINTGTASINRIDKKRKVEILPLIDKWQQALREHGWLMRHLRIWAKRGQLPATISPKSDIIDQHNEYLASFAVDEDTYIELYGKTDKDYSQVITFWTPEEDQRGQERLGTKWAQQGLWDDIQGAKSAGGTHTAAFPLEVPARNILLYTKEGEKVFEPFLGSGTTLIAAEQLNRICFGMELSAKHVDTSIRRFVAWKLQRGESYHVIRNGVDITHEAWLTEQP
jgi:DNA modification methylase